MAAIATPTIQHQSQVLQLPPEILQKILNNITAEDETITIIPHRPKATFNNHTIITLLKACRQLRTLTIAHLQRRPLTLQDTRTFTPSMHNFAALMDPAIASSVSTLILKVAELGTDDEGDYQARIDDRNYQAHITPFANLQLLQICVPSFGVWLTDHREGVLGQFRNQTINSAWRRIFYNEFHTAQEAEDLERMFDFHLGLWLRGLNNDQGLVRMIWNTNRGFKVHFRIPFDGRFREMTLVFDADTGKIIQRDEIRGILCRGCGLRHDPGDDHPTCLRLENKD